MYLFGGKFCMWADRSRPCTCAEVVSRHPMCRCDRKHFNDIVWALVTVFQVPLFLPLLTLYHNRIFLHVYSDIHVYMRSQFYTEMPFFSYLYSCPHFLSVQIAGSYIHIYIWYIYFFVLNKRTPTSDPTVPLSPPTLRPFFSLCYPCRVTEPLMVALYFTCVQSVYTYTCRRSRSLYFVCSRRSKLRDDDSTHECIVISIQHTHHLCIKQLMCCRSRANEFLPFYHVFPFTSVPYDAVWWRIDNFLNVSLHN